jgi:F-type H+-transporting ATPase subunit gamma
VPGGLERTLRRRIRSVTATRKITKAMELIAASQIPRATARIAANRPYRNGMREIVLEAARSDPRAAATMVGTPETVETAMVLSIIGDRGLSGAYNSSVLRATERLIVDLKKTGTQARLITIGKKGPIYFRFRGLPVERSFQGFSDRPQPGDARDVAAALAGPFLAGEAQQILMVSTRFRSAASQAVESRQILPLVVEDDTADDTVAPRQRGYTEFEPEVEALLAALAPVALESEIFTALLEGAASFHTSQQRAMAAATDNADDLSRTLTRVMNRARQDSITTEIMEIVGGAEALRSGK